MNKRLSRRLTKARGVWSPPPWYNAGGAPNPIILYQPKGAASLAASYVNLMNPGTYDASTEAAPALVANGWEFAGEQWINTGYAPVGNRDSIFLKYSGLDFEESPGYLCGVSDYPSYYGAYSMLYGGEEGEYNWNYQNAFSELAFSEPTEEDDVNGIIGMVAMDCYLRGEKIGEVPFYEYPPYPSYYTGESVLYLGTYNYSGTLSEDGLPAGVIETFVVYNQELTEAQAIAVLAAMAGL